MTAAGKRHEGRGVAHHAGKAVFVEKPFTLSLADARASLAAFGDAAPAPLDAPLKSGGMAKLHSFKADVAFAPALRNYG